MTDEGQLVTDGYFAAFVGDDSWYNYHISLGGSDFSQVTEFHLLTRIQDDENYVWIECYPLEGWLACAGHTVLGGQVDPGSGFEETWDLCADGNWPAPLVSMRPSSPS